MEKKSVAVTNKKVSKYIPEEISFSILSKLPVKSLKQFECVQKSWSLLFENHYFMNMFRNNFLSYSDPASLMVRVFENKKQVFYHFYGEKYENKVKLDWLNSSEEVDNCTSMFGFGSVNGTLCLKGYVNYGQIVLWNPTTQTTKVLPPGEAESSIPDNAKDYADVCVLSYLHGFGYDHVRNDYKVIRYVDVFIESVGEYTEDLEEIISLGRMIDTKFGPSWEIYSLRSNSWRKIDVDMPYSLLSYGTKAYMDGVCHWLCKTDSTVGSCLVSFYLSNETFFITSLPSDVDYGFDVKAPWIKLAVLNGSIALISYYKETATFHITILGEFGTKESWTKLLIVGPLSCVERPIGGVGRKGEIFFIRKDNELVWLDLSTQMIAELGYKVVNPHIRILTYKDDILPIEGISN
ncbi:F-box protein [Trifolium medium]|uniref:F-box protein n=1 Tax=Trifolium medium TaxID=97028 RepID=A0A392MJ18_9FABA|nr:F-box protein [Trifolium medium]